MGVDSGSGPVALIISISACEPVAALKTGGDVVHDSGLGPVDRTVCLNKIRSGSDSVRSCCCAVGSESTFGAVGGTEAACKAFASWCDA